MQTITLQAHTGADGVLKLEVSVGLADVTFDVVVVCSPQEGNNVAPQHWQPAFLEKVFGGWQGEPLERAPQGEYEQWESLE
jgi:hypothetical protein